ncbi:Zn peptidase [Clostridium phage HM T]|uniref:Putative Zn peptidase n=1 Tax=Clostridium saccharoperbutylacetonicum N1-4(HMT) TaxID=931276 RepID=M1MIV9_9CLOT|nr:ImmA/IrrE family metallo-endopeptidase [Clostridium saccharoperbutylacetonicum]AMB17414.1 Zn peptidase [Clostridium phage HM T]AGF54766.1 putative Zn peptidase [Clostridium saccharoperbutylacetonicum N1-4(HMT)]NRT58713.1 Zn-dependent peptidase ImmA (M78 family) [Clostridium saccharoperbutylacetonicum]NSB27902.1 Zn-dependent peptidase ImmA (M78 family) [Clostridium saccharoperbutylacetonicum]NSB41385.1 Zn-dependent peptidase ImmA (M78 family) [Clostridium saccharoperbutylacetonicum]
MRKLNEIFCIIEKEKIYLEERNLNQSSFNGIYIKAPDFPPVILVEKSIINDRCKYISVLAEELGHHYTSVGNLTITSRNYSEKLMKNKQEHRAKSWAANFLVSDEEFEQALCNCISNPSDICDSFNMTHEMLKYKIHSIVLDENRYKRIRSALMKKEVSYNSCEI